MNSAQDERAKLAQRIVRTRDKAKLDAVKDVLDGGIQPAFIVAEIARWKRSDNSLFRVK